MVIAGLDQSDSGLVPGTGALRMHDLHTRLGAAVVKVPLRIERMQEAYLNTHAAQRLGAG